MRVTRAEKVRSLTSVTEVSREVLWSLRTDTAARDVRVRAELVSFDDAVEVEVYGAGALIARWRFVRDATARLYGARVRRELEQQGYRCGWHEPHAEW